MQQIDTLLDARWIIPVEPAGAVLEHHSLALHDGQILDLLPSEQARQRYQPREHHQFPSHALIPGLINTHTHAAMTLFRGLADDLPLMTWLNDHIWPAEGAWVNPEFVHDGSELAIAEMLRGGTTCFSDMYFFPDITARAAASSGIRATIGLIMIDFPTAWAAHPDEYLDKGLKLHDSYRHHPLIRTAFAPHAPYTVSDAPLSRIQTLAEELDIPIHIHVHETASEIEQSLQAHHQRPLARLQQLGLLSPRLLAVHMTQLTHEEISQLAVSGSHVIHCPESNLKLASGFCPVHALDQAGVNVALGTDGAASNNDLDMFSEMRTCALLAKAVAGDASAVSAETALRMATLNGARALGIDDITGSLRPGKAADVVAVDLGDIETQPLYHPISQLVYATGRDKVSDVWVAGVQLLAGRQLTRLDSQQLRQRAELWRARIAASDENHQHHQP
ncbi:MAG: TRZ/ATZ family hydrolase [Gammaproteobacteria bacterium]|nr:TRZ/ATZ family hydrolase [Gammaproteobacteria bacterium]